MKAVGAHVGLTGGTLFRGWSSKDLDVIVYPHTTSNPPTLEQIRQVFAEAGFFQSTTEGDQPNPPVHPSRPIKNATDASGKALGRITNREGDNKIITIWSDANGRRIDVFFLDFPDKWFTQEV